MFSVQRYVVVLADVEVYSLLTVLQLDELGIEGE